MKQEGSKREVKKKREESSTNRLTQPFTDYLND